MLRELALFHLLLGGGMGVVGQHQGPASELRQVKPSSLQAGEARVGISQYGT